MIGIDWNAVDGLCSGHGLAPIEISTLDQVRFEYRALQNDTELGFPLGQVDRLVEQRLVGDQPRGFNAARRGNDRFWLGVIDADGKFFAGKATEDDAMDSANPGAGEHCDQGFRHHRHVDDYAIACSHSLRAEHARESGNFIEQLFIANASLRLRNGAVVYNSWLITAAITHMNIHSVVAGIRNAIGIPAIKRGITLIQ